MSTSTACETKDDDLNNEPMTNPKTKSKEQEKTNDEHILVILRGFPGAGKSSLSRAIQNAHTNAVLCSHDKYHWTKKEQGKGTFQFNYKIHEQTRQWCREEALSSMKAGRPLIVIDNANFAKYQYSEFMKFANHYHYKILILEIQSENDEFSRRDHIKHMNDDRYLKNCYLCTMQRHRCKMTVHNHIYKKFIDKYQTDANAVLVKPKLSAEEQWSKEELDTLLSKATYIDHAPYIAEERSWNERKTQSQHQRLTVKHNQRQSYNRRDNERHHRNCKNVREQKRFSRNDHNTNHHSSRHQMDDKDPLNLTLDELSQMDSTNQTRYRRRNNYQTNYKRSRY